MPAPSRHSLLRKRAARLAAAQALYTHALDQPKATADQLASQVLAAWKDSKTNEAHDVPFATQPDAPLLLALVRAALDHHATIEPAIEALILPGWKKSRMSIPLLSTLRACAAEAIAYPKKPRGLLVEEYTQVAAQLVTDDELTFAHKGFNLLLDALKGHA